MDTIFMNSTNGKNFYLHRLLLNLTYEVGWWNDVFDSPNGLYSISDIQDYTEYIITKHETVTHNLPIQISVNKILSRITFEIKVECYLEFLTPKTMKLTKHRK